MVVGKPLLLSGDGSRIRPTEGAPLKRGYAFSQYSSSAARITAGRHDQELQGFAAEVRIQAAGKSPGWSEPVEQRGHQRRIQAQQNVTRARHYLDLPERQRGPPATSITAAVTVNSAPAASPRSSNL